MKNAASVLHKGLSPRVRGNLLHPFRASSIDRSIPACTGEPAGGGGAGEVQGVYPRVYGGTSYEDGAADFTEGLSPRVRGNPKSATLPRPLRRSIPACTGEP